MSRVFFITGLPRSRTCWLANLFTTRESFCYHDLLGQVADVPALQRDLTPDAGRSVGDSDSGLLFAHRWFKAKYPEARWLLVQRDFKAAWDDLALFVAGSPWAEKIPVSTKARDDLMRAYYAAIPALFTDPLCMSIAFEDLDNMSMLQRAWEWLRESAPFDVRRAKLLQTLKIEPFQAKHPLEVNLELLSAIT